MKKIKKTGKTPNLEQLVASPAFARLAPREKLIAMLKVKSLDVLISEGRVFNAKLFGERVGFSYDHIRRLARAGRIDPAPVMLGSGKVWKEYFFLHEHIDALFARRQPR